MMSKEIIKFVPTPDELKSASKKELGNLAKAVAVKISDQGALNELEVYIRARKIADYATALAGAVKGNAENEARKEQGKGKFEKFGATITHTTAGARWHYGNCGDPKLERLEKELKELQEKIATRQSYLQGIPENGEEWIDPETSEMVILRRAVKTSVETISITY